MCPSHIRSENFHFEPKDVSGRTVIQPKLQEESLGMWVFSVKPEVHDAVVFWRAGMFYTHPKLQHKQLEWQYYCKKNHRVAKVSSLNESGLLLDLHCGRRCVRFISLQIPQAKYSVEELWSGHATLHSVLDETEGLLQNHRKKIPQYQIACAGREL